MTLLKQANFGRVDIAVLDFSKAFDTVPRNLLLTKLKCYGIAGNTLTWIREFLTNRTQRVLGEGHGSRLVSVRSGVPQGIVLGPLLFLAFIKVLPHHVQLYKKLKLTNPNSPNYDTIKTNLILKQNIHSAKQIYYETCFHHFRNDIRNTWITINEILTRNQTKHKLPTVFKENGTDITDNINIANKFNIFFTNVGQKIAKDIQYDGNKNYSYYLNKQINSTFTFKNIDEIIVKKTINNLPTKNSCGYDDISSKLLKVIAPAIIKPLTLLINQVLFKHWNVSR